MVIFIHKNWFYDTLDFIFYHWGNDHCNAQSMEKHGLVVNTFIPTHNSVQKTNNRSCWFGGARKKRKLQACNFLSLASIFQITPIFKTNFSSRACINLKWKSCIPLAWYVSIADADGLGLHRQGITSHKADPQLTTYLPAISIRICNYSSVGETSKNTNNHSWFTQPINPLILGSSCISHSNTNDLAYPYQTPRKIGWNLRTLTWLWRNWPLWLDPLCTTKFWINTHKNVQRPGFPDRHLTHVVATWVTCPFAWRNVT